MVLCKMPTSKLPLIFDGHNDTLLALHEPKRGGPSKLLERNEQGHIDVPRMREGGMFGGFFAIFVPSHAKPNDFTLVADANGHYQWPLPEPIGLEHAQKETFAMMARLFQEEKKSEGQLKVVRTVEEIESCLSNGTIAAMLHFEGAEAIDTDLHALEVFYQAGLRSLGMVWSRPNDFATGVPLAFPSDSDIGPGLTDAGKRLVQRCNDLGILVDLAHLNEKGFWDVAKLSNAPLVSSHSAVHAVAPHSRNLTDKQLDAIAESDGLVGILYATGFLRPDGSWDDETSLDIIVRHIDYLVERLGIDRVAFGSDFDGARIPKALGDVTGMPRLLKLLQEVGYGEEDLKKLAFENWLRVLRLTLK